MSNAKSTSARTAAFEREYKALAEAIATQAQAIADGTVTGPVYSQVIKLSANIAMLKAWTHDDRNHTA